VLTQPSFQDFADGVTTIDAHYIRPGLAAIHLLVEGDRALVVDTGASSSVPDVLEVLRRKGLAPGDVAYVIVTHVHLDHAGGAERMMRCFRNASLVVHPRGASHIASPEKLLEGSIAVHGEEKIRLLHGEIAPIPAERIIEAPHASAIDLNGRTLLMLDTPGHARHHLCVFDEKSRACFTGDTFGISYRELDVGGREFILPSTSPVQFDPQAAHASIELILSHAPRAAFLTHYGRVTQLRRLADDLHECLDRFVDLALQTRHAGPVRRSILEKALGDFLLDRLARHGSKLPGEAALALLAEDIDLNTQGLEVWLDSTAPKPV
jgi:glyoxylase-like metal-dependent hydrolase (beta-lactamase superfamily II)